MKNADKPINPCLMQRVGEASYRAHRQGDDPSYIVPTGGLTKREYFAAMAMQGVLIAIPTFTTNDIEFGTSLCVKMADAVLAELEKPTS